MFFLENGTMRISGYTEYLVNRSHGSRQESVSSAAALSCRACRQNGLHEVATKVYEQSDPGQRALLSFPKTSHKSIAKAFLSFQHRIIDE